MPNVEQTRTVLAHALEIIQDRGWTVRFSNGPESPLNLRSAISAAVSHLRVRAEWHAEYSAACMCLQTHLKDGITSWEFGTHATPSRPRTQSEVEAMLTEIINRLEKV